MHLASIQFLQEQFALAKDFVQEASEIAQNQLERKMANELKDKIINLIQMKCNNLIVFLNSSPLVNPDGKLPVENDPGEREMPIEIDQLYTIKTLGSTGKQINVRFNILNKEQLKLVAVHGCRILVINQMMFGSTTICAETGLDTYEELSSRELIEVLGELLVSIDAVFINIPGAKEAASVFKQLGAKHVFYYASASPTDHLTMSEFMRYASLEIIKKLVCEHTMF